MRADQRRNYPLAWGSSFAADSFPVGVWVPGNRRPRGLDRDQLPASLASPAPYPRSAR
jgi:hypothetical protein